MSSLALGLWCFSGALSVELGTSRCAAEPTKAQLDFFESRIRPILDHHCYECHSQESGKSKGGLQLDTRDAVLKGGNTGPALVPGSPEKSLLITAVRYVDPDLKMPPKNKKLSDAQIADLRTWVKMGAPDPRGTAVASGKNHGGDAKKHWAFQPVKRPAPPTVSTPSWAAQPIDAFVLAKLDANGMKPNPPADPRTLIRRATLDLIGLPPTPREVDAFLRDTSPDAFANVVDRLLQSPQYGERWGRYWLDLSRYADTKGDVKRQQEDPHYPNAWTYRDYVIRAFNEDKPYDRFIFEQIAGDKLLAPNATDRSVQAALGFLTLGDHFNGQQHDIINDRIDVVARGFLGLTVTCARCHDHKFDPIPTQDYYSLHGIFASSFEPKELPVLRPPERDAGYSNYVAQYVKTKGDAETVLEKFQQMRRTNGKNVDPQQRRELIREGVEVRAEFAKLEMTHASAPPRAQVLEDSARPKDSPVFIRGEADNRGQIVPRRFLECISGQARKNFTLGSGRSELAAAIASKANPLTSRVMVNRLWQHHFGEGLVTTPDDFGAMSSGPSHPELLDWLAAEFMAKGWSIKQMHREIMRSNTYQQSSANNPRYAATDPANRLLWRANVRRLDFEALRDSVLAIGGKIDLTMGGRPIDLGKEPYPTRRTVYGYIDRNNVSEILYQFDFPNPNTATGKRYETIVPQQALFMMNSPLVVEAARALVQRSDFTALTGDSARVKLLYDLIYQRVPSDVEIKLGQQFLAATPEKDEAPVIASSNSAPFPANRPKLAKKMQANPEMAKKMQERFGGPGGGATPKRQPVGAWEKYAHALLQANEASFVN